MIKVLPASKSKPKPSPENLGFGRYFTDHMFLYDYTPESGWHNPRIVPYGPLPLDPASMVLHYGQEIFEGLKAYYGTDGRVRLFRARDNIKRFNSSSLRINTPPLPEDVFYEAITTLVKTDSAWIPRQPDSTLYIRPFLIATDPFLGVRASHNYTFIIILSPVGAYYPEGLKPTRILIESEDVRAVRGGLGYAKTSANYAATIRAQERAHELGFTQVLWLDGVERRYVEEVGTSNAFFVIDGKVITPPLGGSILPGITRDSCLKLCGSWGIECVERQLSVEEMLETAENGRLSESFASGTAAVVSPVGEYSYKGNSHIVGGGVIGPVTRRLYDTLTGIQWGSVADPFSWVSFIEGA